MKGDFKKDEWMTSFYGHPWYIIEDLDEADELSGPCMVECLVDVSDYRKVDEVQRKGFVIVETAIEFETLIDKIEPALSSIRPAKRDDLETILDITKECYIEHNRFYNRFRNEEFFTLDQAWEYYKNSVVNNFNDKNCLNVVAEDSQGVCAYYVLKKVGDLEYYTKYKGIIAGVTKRAVGRDLHIEMQRKLTEIIGQPYITNNRTQLGNYRVIRNHLREHRQLCKIEHICYLKKS